MADTSAAKEEYEEDDAERAGAGADGAVLALALALVLALLLARRVAGVEAEMCLGTETLGVTMLGRLRFCSRSRALARMAARLASNGSTSPPSVSALVDGVLDVWGGDAGVLVGEWGVLRSGELARESAAETDDEGPKHVGDDGVGEACEACEGDEGAGEAAGLRPSP